MAHALGDSDPQGRGVSDEEEVLTEAGSASSWGDFFDRYSCTVEPDLRLKICKRVKGLQLGAKLTVSKPWQDEQKEQSWALTVRPLDRKKNLQAKVLSKISVLPGDSEVHWRMSKLQLLKFFKIKLAAGYNWKEKRGGLQWNVTTKWNADEHKAVFKQRLPLAGRADLIPHFKAVYGLPSMEGGFGRGNASPRAEVDEGYCHASLPRLDLVVSLDRPAVPSKPFWWPQPWFRSQDSQPRGTSHSPSQMSAQSAELQRPQEQRSEGSEALAKQPAPWGSSQPWRFPWLPESELQAARTAAKTQKIPLPWRLEQPLKLPWLADDS